MKKKIQEIFREGQSALEYVFSYGWSLIIAIMVITGTVLLLPDLFAGESCTTNSALAVSGIKSSDTGFEIVFLNQTGAKVNNVTLATNGSFIANKEIGTLMSGEKTKVTLEASVPDKYDVDLVFTYLDNSNFQKTATVNCKGVRSSSPGSDTALREAFCGDGTCNIPSEDHLTCAGDCPTFCGDNALQPLNSEQVSELCDGSSLDSQTCITQGFTGGTLSCNPNCLGFITSACTNQTCGNNIIEGTETCDGTALNGQTCITMGFTSGTLSCNPNCAGFNTTACSHPPPPSPFGP